MARLVGSTIKACCGDNDDSGWSVELIAAGGRKLEGRGVLCNDLIAHLVENFFCVFGRERKKNCFQASLDGNFFYLRENLEFLFSFNCVREENSKNLKFWVFSFENLLMTQKICH